MNRLFPKKRMDRNEKQWQPPSVLFTLLILCGGLIFFINVFELRSFTISTATFRLPRPRSMGYSEDYTLEGFVIKTEGCRIPDMNAFDPSVAKYIFAEDPIVCNNDTPPLIESNLTSLYLLKTSLSSYGISDINALECCYSVFKRVQSDNQLSFSKRCIKFNDTAKISDEYVQVHCSYNGSEVYEDFFAFVPIKLKVRDKLITQRPSPTLNVLIIGIDTISRLNLHRQMPKTVQMLEELTAVEFMGYNKVGDDTFKNLIAVLTGLTLEELVKECWPNRNERFDNCPFIWKNFSASGFATAFAEDSAYTGIFNARTIGFKRFKNQPTDYFWGQYNYVSERLIGNNYLNEFDTFQCVGARLVYKALLEYADKFVRTMNINKILNFGLFWECNLSHDYLNKPQFGDNDYANFLNELRTNGILNDTALIFMSDHGIRWGGIRTTYQGRMEEKLPFLFIALPEWYRDTYPQVFINLRKNARRLTTPFDLHETLKDLLNPHILTREFLNTRIANRTMKRGYSLFEPIPSDRRCEDAGIASHWCACQQTTTIDKNNTFVVEVARFTVDYINNKLLEGYPKCANLSLAEIYNSLFHTSETDVLEMKNDTQDYTVTFRTIPGDAIFEATVRKYLSTDEFPKSYALSIIGTISRITNYGNQSWCITTDFYIKLYCYCKT